MKAFFLLVEMRGVEPLTSALRTQRSAKLSYIPGNESRVSSSEFRVEASESVILEFPTGFFNSKLGTLDSTLLLHSRRQQRSTRIGGVRVAILDLADDAVKTYVLARDDDYNVTGADLFIIDGEFDDRGVAVLRTDGLVIECVGVKAERLTKSYFHKERL